MKAHDLAQKLLEGENLDVFVGERKTEFGYGLINSAQKKRIGFQEDVGDEIIAEDDVIILSED